MKTKIFTLISAFILLVSFSAEAQILNKLKNKVIERTENVIVDKAADKAAQKTSEAMDKILNQNLDGLFNIGGGTIVDVSNLPAEYSFDFLYKVKMTTGNGEIMMDYLFNKNESYFGAISQLSPTTTMIFDTDKNLFVIKSGESVIAREIKMDSTTESEEAEAEIYNDYTFKEIPSKEFLGIICPGYEMENDENKFTVYIAPDIGVGFGSANGNKIVNMPKEMQAFSKKYEKGLMMYMEMENKIDDKKNDKIATSMECVKFEESKTSVKIR